MTCWRAAGNQNAVSLPGYVPEEHRLAPLWNGGWAVVGVRGFGGGQALTIELRRNTANDPAIHYNSYFLMAGIDSLS